MGGRARRTGYRSRGGFFRSIVTSNVRLEVSIRKGCNFSTELCKWLAEVSRKLADVVRLYVGVPEVGDWVKDPLGVSRADFSCFH